MEKDTSALVSSSTALRDCMFRLGRVMEHVDDLDPLLHRIIEESKQLLACEAASVAMYDAERGDLVFTVASGGADEGLIRQWRMQMGQGIVGLVAESREALFSNDPKTDPRWFGAIDESSSFVTRNLAAVPMVHSDELVGVV
jgi:signal transduction protein with GAF and PtsI domain